MKPEIQESILIQAICLRCGETNSPALLCKSGSAANLELNKDCKN